MSKMTEFWIAVGGLALLTVLILLAMRRGWSARKERTTHVVGELPAAPAALGAARTDAFDATYVGTTLAGQWLERIAGQRLGERAAATVRLFDAGLVVVRQGTDDLYIPFDRFEDVRFDRGIAGKVGDRSRLVVVTWRLEVPVDSGFLLRHPGQAHELVTALRAAAQEKEAG